jgi:hypothetical protein
MRKITVLVLNVVDDERELIRIGGSAKSPLTPLCKGGKFRKEGEWREVNGVRKGKAAPAA